MELGVKCFVAENFDTDLLGTFTGEVERKDDPITTATLPVLESRKFSNPLNIKLHLYLSKMLIYKRRNVSK